MGRIDCDRSDLYEKTLSSETVFEGRVFKCEVKKVECPDGSISSREIVCHNGGACIIPVDDDLNVYMVRQFRSPFEEVMLEVPAGKIEVGEDPAVCAARELIEETGFESNDIISLGYMVATPGYCSEKIYMYLARNLKYVGGNPDSTEFLQNEKFSLSELVEACDRGEIKDAKTAICIYKAARRLL